MTSTTKHLMVGLMMMTGLDNLVSAAGLQGAALGHVNPAPIQAALTLLGWSPHHTPTIEVIEKCPPSVNPLAEGWILRNPDGTAQPTIYVAGWSALYRGASALDAHHMGIRLAGVLAHELAHIEHGPNEEQAYLEQLSTLESLRAVDIERSDVRRALEAVQRQQRERR